MNNIFLFSRNAAETKITSMERNIKTLMVEIEELRQVKINLEGSISKWQAENADWKKKYENEARLRVEEGDALKKKFTMEITSLTDAFHNMEQKLKSAEMSKVTIVKQQDILTIFQPPGKADLGSECACQGLRAQPGCDQGAHRQVRPFAIDPQIDPSF